MTRTDCEDHACCNSMQPILEAEGQAVGAALREVVWHAQEERRLRCGVLECAQLLESDPFSVMLCVMPVSGPDDVSGIIERTLIEAFCHEYHIRLIKVDSVNKLRKILEGREGTSPRTLSNPEEGGLCLATSNPTARVPKSTSSSSSSSSSTCNSAPVWEMCNCVVVQLPESGERGEGEESVGQNYELTAASVLSQLDNNSSAVIALPDD